MEALEDEIAEFWSKSREEVEKDLADAGLDPAPVAEAVAKLMQEKLGVSALK